MLNHLRISNFALIDELQISLNKGFSTITGETGAGKSIILGGLKLVLGERADLNLVKNKDVKCVVEAVFLLTPHLETKLNPLFTTYDLDFDTEVILRREILPSAKSRAFINDTPVNLAILKEISEQLIDIHSQFNTAELLAFDYQIEILDLITKNQVILKGYQTKLSDYKKVEKKLTTSNQQVQELQNTADYNTFLLNELKDANLENENLERLETQEKELSSADEILESLSEITQQIENENFGLETTIREIANKLQKLSRLSENFNPIYNRIESLNIEFSDFFSELQSMSESIETNPETLIQVKERLDLIQSLFRKHQVNSIDELIEIQTSLQSKNANFEDITTEIQILEKQKSKLESELNQRAIKLHNSRKKVAPKVEKSIQDSLKKLGMENAQIQFNIEQTEGFNPKGKDKITLLFSANKGIQPKDIEKSVSGGERSRLMLSIKELIAKHQSLPTLIFDEIDTGVSGKIADEMANVMLTMANTSQIISITHLPQVAAKGEHQLKVFKESSETKIKPLNKDERLLEIAGLISGDNISAAAKEQAKELLKVNM